MRTKRNSVFETNSSTVNTLSLFRESDWNRFKNGELSLHRVLIEDENGHEWPKLYLSEESGGRTYEEFITGAVVETLDGVVGTVSEEYDF